MRNKLNCLGNFLFVPLWAIKPFYNKLTATQSNPQLSPTVCRIWICTWEDDRWLAGAPSTRTRESVLFAFQTNGNKSLQKHLATGGQWELLSLRCRLGINLKSDYGGFTVLCSKAFLLGQKKKLPTFLFLICFWLKEKKEWFYGRIFVEKW